ncbi:MAG: hypothetical protein R2911_24460 [Caldilineaceae bacterium]
MKEHVGSMRQHIEIAPAVVVKISPHRAAAQHIRQADALRKGRNGKGSIALIVIKHIGRLVAGHVQIHPAVVVIIAPRLPHGQIAVGKRTLLAVFIPTGLMDGGNAGGLAHVDKVSCGRVLGKGVRGDPLCCRYKTG